VRFTAFASTGGIDGVLNYRVTAEAYVCIIYSKLLLRLTEESFERVSPSLSHQLAVVWSTLRDVLSNRGYIIN
jgi:hypothetical protein